jgi:hypothetical protein
MPEVVRLACQRRGELSLRKGALSCLLENLPQRGGLVNATPVGSEQPPVALAACVPLPRFLPWLNAYLLVGKLACNPTLKRLLSDLIDGLPRDAS